MEITYLGHSAFHLKGKRGTVVTDPYQAYVGFAMPSVSADIVTCSHDHPDHNAVEGISNTARRDKPFIITQPGEYEVAGVSVFGIESYHDAVQGAERGRNTIFTILLDELRICHLGDLGHPLTNDMIESIGQVDVLLVPVGGHFTINPSQAIELIHQLEPSYVIPMHYKTEDHDDKVFGDVLGLDAFLKEYGMNPVPQAKFKIEKSVLPEETELVVLSSKG